MCGVTGVWSADGDQAPAVGERENWGRNALEVMRHRGPESDTVESGDHFTLGHSLLSFRKTYGDRQPYVSQRAAVAFNGEIYNLDELRRVLGMAARPASEVAVIARAFEAYGVDFATRLRGMYAIAIVDRRDGSLHLYRDPLGKKPLYFQEAKGVVRFSSELTPLLDRTRALEPRAVCDYLLFNALPPDRCIVSGVEKAPPGCRISWRANARETTVHWRALAREDGSLKPADCVERLEAALANAVRRRLQSGSEAPGLLVSGGVDSSLIAAMAVKERPDIDWRCYSGRFPGDGFDETPSAALLAQTLGIRRETIDLTDEVLKDAAIKYCALADEPIADPSFVALGAIMERARLGNKFLLTGDGADDILFGYSFYAVARPMHALSSLVPTGVAASGARALAKTPGRDANMNLGLILNMLSRGLTAPPEWRFAHCASAFSPYEADRDLEPEFAAAATAQRCAPACPNDVLRRTQAGMMYGFLQSSILTKLDRASMLNSMELRSPFLDLDVVEASLAFPARDQLRGGSAKRFVKSVAERWTPRALVHQKKRGFRLPVRRLTRGVMATEIKKYLNPEVARTVGVFKPDALERISQEHFEKGLDHSKKIWTVYCLNKWAMSRVVN